MVLFGAGLGLCEQLRLPLLTALALQKIGVPLPSGLSLLPILLEVCSGTAAAACTAENAVFLAAFALGWGGICVHFQIFSVLGELRFSRGRFFFFRLLHGLLSGGISLLLALLLPQTGIIAVLGPVWSVQTSNGVPFTLALLLLIFVFLLSLPSGGGNLQRKMVK